jgi:WS/DGAT/MGAT family acyltransferase
MHPEREPARRGNGESAVAYSYYERLSALDATFLEIESEGVHMHVGALAIFAGGGLRAPEGGLDFERIRALAEPALRRTPRFRQRLARIPFFGRPVWVDDPAFAVDYHLRFTALPEPGDERQLKRMAGRIFSQKLDLQRSPWELWFIEGLAGGRFAVLSKIHHCMIDGVSGADLLAGFMAASEDEAGAGAAPRRIPRPAPGPAQLLADELARRAALPFKAAGAGLRLALHPVRGFDEASHAARAIGSALFATLGSASNTPLNAAVGPYRRFDWTRMDLPRLRELKTRLGATLNDVALALVAGALRRFLERRGVSPDELDFRAMLPVSVRSPDQRGRLGNRVAFLIAQLPVDEADPRRRVERVIETTRRLKASDVVRGGELLEELGDWTLTNLVARLSRLAATTRSYNMVVTNVPGPAGRLELLGARLEEVYPLVPLFSNQGLGIALFSYESSLFWGFNADWDAVPDLHELVDEVQQELEVLGKLEAGGAA